MTEAESGKRRHPRICAELPVRISALEPDRDGWTGRPFFRALCESSANLSRGGAFILTDEPLAPGRRILLELELPGSPTLEAIGRVAWSRRVMSPRGNESEAGIGIEFLGGEPDQFSVLEAYIDQHRGD